MSGPVEPAVMPPEVLDLLRFMCATWVQIDEWAHEHVKGDAIMNYPVIQGTGNQMRLRRIGRQPYDSKALHVAAEWMQRHNAALRRGAGTDTNCDGVDPSPSTDS